MNPVHRLPSLGCARFSLKQPPRPAKRVAQTNLMHLTSLGEIPCPLG
jgi:hypothetical protein